MNILLAGGTGFLGRHCAAALREAGHTVRIGTRSPRAADEIELDFTRAADPAWRAAMPGLLKGYDCVINAVGILVESPEAPFTLIHRDAPCALIDACAAAGVPRMLQISALGAERAEPGGALDTPYMRTKRAAELHLMASLLDWAILRPSLVYGADGASAAMFRALAVLPIHALPGDGAQPLRPVHVDDLAQAVARLVESPGRRTVALVGGTATTYAGMLAHYRAGLGLDAAPRIPLPLWLMRAAAHAARWLPQRVFTPDTLRMLEAGNSADDAATATLLGHAPRGIENFIAPATREALRAQAVLSVLVPLFRAVLAALWIVTAVVSLWVYPRDESLAMLARTGLTGAWGVAALWGAGLLDLAFGVATLARPSRALWLAQIALIVAYSAVIALCLPEFWLHPFAPMVKNLPVLALLAALFLTTPARRSAR